MKNHFLLILIFSVFMFSTCSNRKRIKVLYKDGKIKQEAYLNREGKVEDTLINYYRNGIISSKIHFVNGIIEGKSIYYDSVGHLLSIEDYKNSKKNGKVVHYYRSGKVKWIKYFKDNTLIDNDTAYSPKGHLMFISDFDKKGYRLETRYFNEKKEMDMVCKYYDKYQAFYHITDSLDLKPYIFFKNLSTSFDTVTYFLKFENGKYEYSGDIDYISKNDSVVIEKYYPKWQNKLKKVAPRPVRKEELKMFK